MGRQDASRGLLDLLDFNAKHSGDLIAREIFRRSAETIRQLENARRPCRGWRCFHCGEHFDGRADAMRHFGGDEGKLAACQIKATEGGLLRALRDAEQAADEAYRLLHDECSDIAKAFHAATARHSLALIEVEELGYARGLLDGSRAGDVILKTHAAEPGAR